jgi:hypothetical protein
MRGSSFYFQSRCETLLSLLALAYQSDGYSQIASSKVGGTSPARLNHEKREGHHFEKSECRIVHPLSMNTYHRSSKRKLSRCASGAITWLLRPTDVEARGDLTFIFCGTSW